MGHELRILQIEKSGFHIPEAQQSERQKRKYKKIRKEFLDSGHHINAKKIA